MDGIADQPGLPPACPLPGALVAAADGVPTVAGLRAAAADSGLTKFVDVNLTQVLTDAPLRDTIEVRILPGAMDADAIVSQAALVELLLSRCLDPEPFPAPPADPGEAVSDLLDIAARSLAAQRAS